MVNCNLFCILEDDLIIIELDVFFLMEVDEFEFYECDDVDGGNYEINKIVEGIII